MRAKASSKLEISYCRHFGQIEISFARCALSGVTTDITYTASTTEFETRNKLVTDFSVVFMRCGF